MLRSSLPRKYVPEPPYRLRDLQVLAYQESLFNARQGHSRLNIVAPPGFGKSLVGITLGGHLLSRGLSRFDGVHRTFRGVIVIVPSKQIIPSFTKYMRVEVPGGVGRSPHQPYTLDLAESWAQEISLTNPESATSDEIEWFFGKNGGGILVMCSQMLLTHWDKFPKDLSQYMFHLDESHHAPKNATEIGKRRDEWQKRGALTLQTSATPWHTETGERIYEVGEPVVNISLCDLKDDGLVPAHFEFDRVMLKYEAKTIKEMLLQVEPTEELIDAYMAIAEFWVSQGEPVTVIRPPDKRHVEALMEVFERAGTTPLNATGDDFDPSELAADRDALRYKDLKYKVIIACRRFDEGTDHPLVANVYYIGAPGSVRLVIQLIGRAMRLKIAPDYPKEWRDKAGFTAFIPYGIEASSAYLDVHMQDVTMLAAYLADVDVGDHIISNFSSRLRRSFVHGTKRGQSDTDRVIKSKTINVLCGDDISKAEATAVLTNIKARVSRKRNEPLSEVSAAAVAKEILTIQDPAMRSRVACLCIDDWRSSPDESLREAADRFEAQINQIIEDVKDGEDLDGEIHRATLAVGDALKMVTKDFTRLHTVGVHKGLLAIMSRFTSLDAEEIATKLRRLCMSNPTKGEVVRAMSSYIKRERKYPNRQSGSCERDGLPGYTWAQIASNWAVFNLPADSLEDYGAMYMGAKRQAKRTQRRR